MNRLDKLATRIASPIKETDFNSDYFNLPKYDYSKNKTTSGNSVQSTGSSGGGGGLGGNVNTAALNTLADPFANTAIFPKTAENPTGIPKRNWESEAWDMSDTFNSEYHSPIPEEAEEYLELMKKYKYNPDTSRWDRASSPYVGYDKIPAYMNAIDSTLMFGSPNADTSNLSVNPYNPDSIYTPAKSIADNAGDIQASIMQLTHDNPTASVQQIHDAHHEDYTGFDSAGNFTGAPVDPGTAAMNAIHDYGQPSGSFNLFSKGGKVGGGK